MRFYNTTQVQEDTLNYIECDICHKKFVGDNWNGGLYDLRETEIRMTIGKEYPYSCHVDENTIFDVCPECFREKIIPLCSQN